jgi:sensor domain CHASE-containing protein
MGAMSAMATVEHYVVELRQQIALGNKDAAATAARTIEQEMHLMLFELDPTQTVCAAITTSNGRYAITDPRS